jgi:serine/threonine protein phosphatase PrpC
VIGRTVYGATHRRNGIPVQDAIRWTAADADGASWVLALADGHGSPLCLRSKAGAELAVATATRLLGDFYREHSDDPKSRLKAAAAEQIPKPLVHEWQEAVARHLRAHPLSPEEWANLETKLGSSALTEATECGSGDDISLGILCRKHESPA